MAKSPNWGLVGPRPKVPYLTSETAWEAFPLTAEYWRRWEMREAWSREYDPNRVPQTFGPIRTSHDPSTCIWCKDGMKYWDGK
ncbi:unnamed protein product [marine sediment metagenome]|uniref:Uncharacterized protein n=1 Tax=marine sediment metagenome TaxID=412755 RepID=X0RTM6_9ZZZZ